MKVVLDTNIVISGIFFPKGVPAKVLRACFEEERFQVFATPGILKEYFEVIQRMSMNKAISFTHDWDEILSESCHLIKDADLPEGISRDPADDKFIACAGLSGAKYLITGDKDLLVLNGKFDFSIVTPKDFLELLK